MQKQHYKQIQQRLMADYFFLALSNWNLKRFNHLTFKREKYKTCLP